ncbi:MAG: GLPGLI family protein [Dysgonamonadaceae bacterium]|jgi:GLPGLI family protein|nr:GLPGLI family protein [Dysgonamonadaceae bacterium]
MKQILIVLALLYTTIGQVHAQVRLLDFAPPTGDTLGYSKIRCVYEQYVLEDTVNPQKKPVKNQMYLQIGEQVSKYMSCFEFQSDSLMADDYKKKNNVDIVEAIQSGRYGKVTEKYDKIQLYKNFPEHKNTIRNRIAGDNYIYQEDIVKPQWRIENEKATVLGYSCIKATTTFCGRNYMAWFTPDIPVSDGPWKFTGLPGLILRVYDDKGQVTFECTQILKVGWKDPIVKPKENRNTIKTSKEDFYKQLKRYCDNPTGVANSNTRVTTTATRRILPRMPYNPIERIE